MEKIQTIVYIYLIIKPHYLKELIMNILNNVKNLNLLVVLAISLMVFSNCQNENAVLEK